MKAPDRWQKERDLFEHSALLFAWEHGLPVLGVCRGLQLINVSCRGTLIQDLGLRGDEVHENTKEMMCSKCTMTQARMDAWLERGGNLGGMS